MPSNSKDKGRKKKSEIEIIGPRTSATFMPKKLRLLASRRKYDDHHASLLSQLAQEEKNAEEEKKEIESNASSEYYEAQEGDQLGSSSRRQNLVADHSATSRLRQKLEKSELKQSMAATQKEKLSEREQRETSKFRTNWLKFRIFCGKTINNDAVQIAMIVIIIVNSLFMGVATFDFVTDDPEMLETFKTIDRYFLVVYTVELLMQFTYFGWRMIQDAWLAFDLIVVAISWVFDFYDGGGNLQIIRAFRIFRSFRLLTRIKVLRDLVAAIGQVIPRLIAVGTLLLLVFYIFSVLFTELFYEVEVEGGYPFATLHDSLFTSVELMTLEWGDFARTCMEFDPYLGWIPFVIFIFMSGFIVFNLIIAVICDAVSIIDDVAREREAMKQGIVIETPEEQLNFAKSRIAVLEERVLMMQKSHQNMQILLEVLAAELCESKGDLMSAGESSIPSLITGLPRFSETISGIFGGKDRVADDGSK